MMGAGPSVAYLKNAFFFSCDANKFYDAKKVKLFTGFIKKNIYWITQQHKSFKKHTQEVAGLKDQL